MFYKLQRAAELGSDSGDSRSSYTRTRISILQEASIYKVKLMSVSGLDAVIQLIYDSFVHKIWI